MFILAVLGLHCCAGFSLVAGSGDDALVAVCGLLIVVASLVGSAGSRVHRLQSLWHTGSVVAAHRRSCSAACGVFLDQESNPCLLPWQADSYSLSCQGSPILFFNAHIVTSLVSGRQYAMALGSLAF